MFDKSKLVLISAVAAVSITSSAMAQALNPVYGTGNTLPFVYGPGGTKSVSPIALPNDRFAGRRTGLYDFAKVRHSHSASVRHSHSASDPAPSGYDPSIATQR